MSKEKKFSKNNSENNESNQNPNEKLNLSQENDEFSELNLEINKIINENKDVTYQNITNNEENNPNETLNMNFNLKKNLNEQMSSSKKNFNLFAPNINNNIYINPNYNQIINNNNFNYNKNFYNLHNLNNNIFGTPILNPNYNKFNLNPYILNKYYINRLYSPQIQKYGNFPFYQMQYENNNDFAQNQLKYFLSSQNANDNKYFYSMNINKLNQNNMISNDEVNIINKQMKKIKKTNNLNEPTNEDQNNNNNNINNENINNLINIENIILGKDKRTTLMIKNIPNKYTLNIIIKEININFKNKYDLFYLPIDYANKCNLGFAFINFVNSFYIIEFYNLYIGKKWKYFNSEKKCDLLYAKIQGKRDLIKHFEKGKILSLDSEDKKPLILPTPINFPKIKIPIEYLNFFIKIYPFSIISFENNYVNNFNFQKYFIIEKF